MQRFFIGMLAWALGGSAAAPAEPQQNDGASITTTGAKSSIEEEFKKLEAEDEAAQAEVDKWKRENNEARTNASGIPEAELEKRIQTRLEPVGKAYQAFLNRHSDHAGAHLAYGCFLNERQDEAGARREWERALELAPHNADIYNNLAGSYSEGGPAKKAFDYFTKAIELKPTEAAYYHNFGTTLYVLRRSGMTYYGMDEQKVFAKVVELYSNAVRLAPQNLSFATDLAQTYYSLKPLPTDTALAAWTNALQAAHTETEREEVFVHLARVKMLAGDLKGSRALLNLVTNESQKVSKANLLRAIDSRQNSLDPSKEEARPQTQ